MKPDAAGEGERWFAQAERDAEAARLLSENGHHNLACFHCQQAVEKALKSFLYSRGARDIRGHAAGELCDAAATLDPSFKELRRAVVLADKYYIPTRYPNGLADGGLPFEAYDAEDAAKAIRMAQAAIDFIRPRLAVPT
ncbi:MAG: HEPN domain-containing protein [Bacillota bacterium]|nr:MAG: HEPN domain-containing protein [Bacillota bacterium]